MAQRRTNARSSSTTVGEGAGGTRPPALAVVVSRYNASITDRLLAGARQAFEEAGGEAARLTVIPAPGAYELPGLSLAAARTGRFGGVLALGCLIKGETSHDRYIAEAVAHGLVQVTMATGVPCAFGVLTCDTSEQAEDRAGGAHGNKGAESMDALIDAVREISALARGGARRSGAPGFGKASRTIPDKAKQSRGRRR